MKKTECVRRSFYGVRVDAWDDNGIACWDSAGVVTQGAALLSLGECHRQTAVWQSAGLVARYSKAALGLDAEALFASAARVVAGSPGGLALPTALVVQCNDLPMWRTYAELMARNGIVRGVFVSEEAALRWVATQAAVFRAEVRHQSQACSR